MILAASKDKDDYVRNIGQYEGAILLERKGYRDMLLALGQPAAALKEYEASQQREPNRFRGWYGAATAAAKSGDAAKATKYFSALTKLAEKGDKIGRAHV